MFIYFNNKRALLRFRCVKSAIGLHLSMSMIELAEAFVPIFCLANVLFDYVIVDKSPADLNASLTFGAFADIFLQANSYTLIGTIPFSTYTKQYLFI
jgi:hypothetical protein